MTFPFPPQTRQETTWPKETAHLPVPVHHAHVSDEQIRCRLISRPPPKRGPERTVSLKACLGLNFEPARSQTSGLSLSQSRLKKQQTAQEEGCCGPVPMSRGEFF